MGLQKKDRRLLLHSSQKAVEEPRFLFSLGRAHLDKSAFLSKNVDVQFWSI